MKAVVKLQKGKGFVEYKDMPEPTIGEDEVLIEVKAVAICGSDIHIYHDAHPMWPPMIMGHEFSGVIVKTGSKVKNWKIGDRISSETKTKSCGTCYFCQTGNAQICPDKRPFGIGIDGAMAKYVAGPAKLLHALPDSISFEAASLCEPIAVCVHALLERTQVTAGETVFVSGAGPIGLICAMLAKAAGAYVIVSDLFDNKLKKALELGVDMVVNPKTDNVAEKINALTNNLGVDIVVECSGAGPAIKTVFELVRRHGKICALGLSGKPAVEVPWDVAIFKAPKVNFCFSSNWPAWETTIKLIERKQIFPEKLITHRLPLEKWKEAFEAIEKGEAIKAILIP